MITGSNRQVNGKWTFNLTLDEINLTVKLSAASIPYALVSVEKYCNELNKKTQFDIAPNKDFNTKDGNRFTQIFITFSEIIEMPQIAPPKKLTRKLIPHPSAAVGS